MTLSIRLDDKTKQALRARARRTGVTLSELVRIAVIEKLDSTEQSPPHKTPYEHWQEIFTGNDSGGANDSSQMEGLVAKAVCEKYDRRRLDTR
jgi:predicted transcriptional regulator